MSSQRSKNHVADMPKKVGPLDRARSHYWVVFFHFRKVPRAPLGTLTRNFGSSGASLRRHINWKMMKFGPKWVHSRWPSATLVGFPHMLDRVLGSPGMSGDLLLAFSNHTESIIVVHLGLFEIASSHCLRLRYDSEGQSESPQPGWMNRCSSLPLSLSDVPGKVYT